MRASAAGLCPSAPKCDVSQKDSVRALYKQLTGEDLDTRHDCIQQSSTFPGVVAIGHFAHDDGCRYE